MILMFASWCAAASRAALAAVGAFAFWDGPALSNPVK